MARNQGHAAIAYQRAYENASSDSFRENIERAYSKYKAGGFTLEEFNAALTEYSSIKVKK